MTGRTAPSAPARRTTLPQRRSVETRRRILDAAYRVFVRAGYGSASVDEIVAEADVSKGALYHHFRGKDEIFRAILEDHVRRCADRMTASVVPGASIGENVERVLRASWALVTADPAWPALQMEFWVHATRDEHARAIISSSNAVCLDLVSGFVRALQDAGVVERGIDPSAAARLFVAVNDGILLQWRVEPDACDPAAIVSPMAAMITRFLTCGDARPPRPDTGKGAVDR